MTMLMSPIAAMIRARSARSRVPVLLVAHGSRDPRFAATLSQLADGVRARWPAPLAAAFIDFNPPSVPVALRELADAGGGAPVVVPALLTSAYHRRVDLPELLAASGVRSIITDVLGPARPDEAPHPWLLKALRRRLSEVEGTGASTLDGLVLMAAGTSDVVARSTVDTVAAMLGHQLGVVGLVGYASGSGPTAAQAVADLRRAGAHHILVASYFLAPGRLYDAAALAAQAAGAIGVAQPLGAAEEIVRLVVRRIWAALANE